MVVGNDGSTLLGLEIRGCFMNLGHSIGVAAGSALKKKLDDDNKPNWSLIGHQIGSWSIEYVRVVVQHFDPVRFEVWLTQNDERTCPICGQLNGRVWEQGEGFTPPVHDHCRCERVYHHTEFNVRLVEEWQQRQTWQTKTQWSWQRTS